MSRDPFLKQTPGEIREALEIFDGVLDADGRPRASASSDQSLALLVMRNMLQWMLGDEPGKANIDRNLRKLGRLVKRIARGTRIPHPYVGELSLPLRWQDDQTGQLQSAVRAYLDERTDTASPASEADRRLLVDYLDHYINAPCWNDHLFDEEIESLRDRVLEIETTAEIADWIHGCLAIGLDPL